MDTVVRGICDLINFIGKLGELARSLAAHILKHMGRQDKLVAVGNMGVDEVVQQRPLQPCAHTGVHPVTGSGQLDTTGVVNESQTFAQIHMVLGLKIKVRLFTHIA